MLPSCMGNTFAKDSVYKYKRPPCPGSSKQDGLEYVLCSINCIHDRPKFLAVKQRILELWEDAKAWEREFRLSYQDDPAFINFLGAIPNVRTYKAFALWWVSARFREHWIMASPKTMSRLIWTMIHYELYDQEIAVVVRAWMNLHGRYPSEFDWRNEFAPTLKKAKDEAKPGLKERRKKRNAKRRKQYAMKRGPKVQTVGVKPNILEELKKQPCTPALLVKRLGATRNAIDSALFKLVRAGTIIKQAHGLYALPQGMHSSTSKGPVKDRNPSHQPIPVVMKTIRTQVPVKAECPMIGINTTEYDPGQLEKLYQRLTFVLNKSRAGMLEMLNNPTFGLSGLLSAARVRSLEDL